MQTSAASARPHGHEGQTRKKSCEKRPWSALHTHLQGGDWATPSLMPEECRHRAALLSRFSYGKITRLSRKGKHRRAAVVGQFDYDTRIRPAQSREGRPGFIPRGSAPPCRGG